MDLTEDGIGELSEKQVDLSNAETENVVESVAHDTGIENMTVATHTKGRITRFAQPRYKMFENRDRALQYNEYGRNLDDLNFKDVKLVVVR